MYEPVHFRIDDVPTLHAFIRERPLGLLIRTQDGRASADAIPFLLDTEAGGLGRLKAHVARANPLWREADEAEVLVVFQGHDHYVSPGWYPSKAETGRVVPTWNYAMAQARGRLVARQDRAWLEAQASALTDQHERSFSPAWAMDDAPADFRDAQMAAIVGIEIEITDLRGKFKLSQNKSGADRRGVEGALAETNRSPDALRLMRSRAGTVD